MFLARRMLSATWIILATGLVIEAKIAIYIVIQTCSFVYIVTVRPLESNKENLIEAIHDSIYILICCFLLHYNRVSRWNNSIGSIVVSILTVNGLIILFIQLIDLMISLVIYCKRKNATKQKVKPSKFFDNSRLDSVHEMNVRKISSNGTNIASNSQLEKELKQSNGTISRPGSRIENYISEENQGG
mmetsp:Transcript_39/g.36  ORF Transcript_39/g.36 Transcript_39/m.36 type:complete len:187 (-) Transcript_39:86-646(-)